MITNLCQINFLNDTNITTYKSNTTLFYRKVEIPKCGSAMSTINIKHYHCSNPYGYERRSSHTILPKYVIISLYLMKITLNALPPFFEWRGHKNPSTYDFTPPPPPPRSSQTKTAIEEIAIKIAFEFRGPYSNITYIFI